MRKYGYSLLDKIAAVALFTMATIAVVILAVIEGLEANNAYYDCRAMYSVGSYRTFEQTGESVRILGVGGSSKFGCNLNVRFNNGTSAVVYEYELREIQ